MSISAGARAAALLEGWRSGPERRFLDVESPKPDKLDGDVVEMFSVLNPKSGDVLIAYGWTMAEDLVKLGKR